jgi:hypothetical protein
VKVAKAVNLPLDPGLHRLDIALDSQVILMILDGSGLIRKIGGLLTFMAPKCTINQIKLI